MLYPDDELASGAGGGVGAAITDTSDTQDIDQPTAPAPLTLDSVRSMILEETGKATAPLHEKVGELTSENTILRQRLQETMSRPQPQVQQPQPAAYTNEQFLDDMKADPLGTLRKFISGEFMPRVEATVRGTRNEIEGTANAREQFQNRAEADRNAALEITTKYGEPNTPDRLEFEKEANVIYTQLVRQAGGYLPGQLETAALRAHSKLIDEGKGPKSAPSGTKIVQFPASNGIRSSTGAGGGPPQNGGPTQPRNLDDFVAQGKLTNSEVTGIRSNMRKWGMYKKDKNGRDTEELDEARWVRSYLENEKENPRYGTGA